MKSKKPSSKQNPKLIEFICFAVNDLRKRKTFHAIRNPRLYPIALWTEKSQNNLRQVQKILIVVGKFNSINGFVTEQGSSVADFLEAQHGFFHI